MKTGARLIRPQPHGFPQVTFSERFPRLPPAVPPSRCVRLQEQPALSEMPEAKAFGCGGEGGLMFSPRHSCSMHQAEPCRVTTPGRQPVSVFPQRAVGLKTCCRGLWYMSARICRAGESKWRWRMSAMKRAPRLFPCLIHPAVLGNFSTPLSPCSSEGRRLIFPMLRWKVALYGSLASFILLFGSLTLVSPFFLVIRAPVCQPDTFSYPSWQDSLFFPLHHFCCPVFCMMNVGDLGGRVHIRTFG